MWNVDRGKLLFRTSLWLIKYWRVVRALVVAFVLSCDKRVNYFNDVVVNVLWKYATSADLVKEPGGGGETQRITLELF